MPQLFSESINISFRSLVSEFGAGTSCRAVLALRTILSSHEKQFYSGIGFSLDGLSARFAAEGEAIERATWASGSLWNDVYFTGDSKVLPDEPKLLIPGKWKRRILENPITVIPALENGERKSWIPSPAVFYYPPFSYDWIGHSVTTGWAYHTDKQTAAQSAYLEVIERDLAMLFWFGLLKPYLISLDESTITEWGKQSGLLKYGNQLLVMQMIVRIHACYGTYAYYTLVIHTSEEKPYLSIGQALKTNPHQSFKSAIGEYLMLRSNQHEQILTAISNASDLSFTSHVVRANQEIDLREEVLALTKNDFHFDSLQESRLDYSKQHFWLAYFNPPPITKQGIVAKVWINGCQPMVPAGVPCGLVDRWKNDWKISEKEWENKRWHPFP